jgi:hypothetical protein
MLKVYAAALARRETGHGTRDEGAGSRD